MEGEGQARSEWTARGEKAFWGTPTYFEIGDLEEGRVRFENGNVIAAPWRPITPLRPQIGMAIGRPLCASAPVGVPFLRQLCRVRNPSPASISPQPLTNNL